METILIAPNYALRQATSADLRESWRRSSETETLVEFEHRLTQSPELEGITLVQDGTPFGMLQVRHMANDELWLGVISFSAQNDDDCSELLTAAAGQALANGCPRVWLRVTDPTAGEMLRHVGWTPGIMEEGSPLEGLPAGQWFSYDQTTWQRAQYAPLN